MWQTTKSIVLKVWKVAWLIWSVLVTVSLVALLIVIFGLEWRARRAIDPSQITLMPAPTLISQGVVEPFEQASDKDFQKGIGVFYATDRAPSQENDDTDFYRNKRGDRLRLGIGSIGLGEGITSWDELKKISVSSQRDRDYLMRVENTRELGMLEDSRTSFTQRDSVGQNEEGGQTAFANLIDKKFEQSNRKDIYIYVHGYKVVFENPLLVATEFWHYLGYEGAMIAFAWPSTPDFLAYGSDLETTRYSARNLRKLIEFLARETQAEQIHVLGYSAGTRLVMATLNELALIHSTESKQEIQNQYRVGQVVLVCSDIDRGIFAHQLENGVWKIPERLTIYVSRVDATLGMSELVFRRQRIGRLLEDESFSASMNRFLRQQDHVDLIDVSNAENVSANNGHAYFHKSPWVSSDVLLTLGYKLPPADRRLSRSEDSPLWFFAEDYPERIREVKVGGE